MCTTNELAGGGGGYKIILILGEIIAKRADEKCDWRRSSLIMGVMDKTRQNFIRQKNKDLFQLPHTVFDLINK